MQSADSIIQDVESKAVVEMSTEQNVQVLAHPLLTVQASLVIHIQETLLQILPQQKQKKRTSLQRTTYTSSHYIEYTMSTKMVWKLPRFYTQQYMRHIIDKNT